ncbi:3-methyl-2-oxobutanoate hydroxymethyltransferase [Saccharolobus islandicus]|uniref:3-methyl-2-oxobutanoate hydroxymethyltransferase n=3 Tax=Saccharolobus islandicus TaxID=43080 RepID=PANB_SACI3|nr:3-methyl-2-oxobutanoate hydroxymethyltransferase [Sulfolobus islandicus]C3MU48.1 RecName: Full=3-methyl-2-oxobutanoate hydroxymethyltransferase; AltName: Full=Ketopantoate hydroxymethyltransferase; Short=KPHMT [Sulfolobus islandicus M.14.25]C3N136.1 RecName: Full=3-methyl-2-oxobutanoate hydroxymethyltransferase; AltName: Full=Ketopantoate hydroxymethyltransferase; Short=KPHMT [Sulfolobus islandicus M.16.27]C4KKA3.1 RecName: Full=3-methyl-2-oxobutanoate hydroxymethyltransferase; AltName: Full=
MKKVTIRDFIKKKSTKEKITILTAYDYPTAKIISNTGLDSILVGDSLGMVVLGYANTLNVTMRDMISHTRAVARANPPQLIVADMPFLSYEIDTKSAVKNAGLLVKAGSDAIKLEGGEEMKDTVKAIVKAGIPVMGHIGLTPQRFLRLGGFRTIGKTKQEEDQLIKDSLELEDAGVFSLVIENTYVDIAKRITEKLNIPTICIGAGPYCDGQVLVINDLLGLSEFTPYFAKSYVNLKEIISNAINQYIIDVKNNKFPEKQHYKEKES